MPGNTEGRRRPPLRACALRWFALGVATVPVLLAQTHTLSAADAASDLAAPPPVYVASTRADRIGRVMAPVYVNGQGPFAFVVDTGASRSTIAPQLAMALDLHADPDKPILVRGVTGNEKVPSVSVDSLRAGNISLGRRRVPLVAAHVLANANGILGTDAMLGNCLQIRFDLERIRIDKGRCPRADHDWTPVPARLIAGGVLSIRARVNHVVVRAVIDTGAEHTLGNRALFRALGLDLEAGRSTLAARVYGATDDVLPGSLAVAPRIAFGDLEVAAAPVAYGDFSVFALWDLDRTPALIVGMDLLGTLDALEIDYPRREVRFLPHNSPARPRLRVGETPTRLP
ncbi:MAG: retropepsin-like domain-containing protein [Gammaproteobacteria bacterium]|nr:retropepsin-like domain-containing protein [Gammaproteobacteria bacterium]